MWTRDFPTEPGYYWTKLNYGLTTIEYFYFDEYPPYELMVLDSFDEHIPAEIYREYEPEFYGPLKEPKV